MREVGQNKYRRVLNPVSIYIYIFFHKKEERVYVANSDEISRNLSLMLNTRTHRAKYRATCCYIITETVMMSKVIIGEEETTQ